MKKFTAVTAALCMTLALAACQEREDDDDDDDNEIEDSRAAPSPERPVVAWMPPAG